MSVFQLPAPLRSFFVHFPLHTYDPILPKNKKQTTAPTLWIAPPRTGLDPDNTDLLSSDVKCLKWQAYLALRGVTGVQVRYDVAPDGGIDGRLPNLQVSLEGRVASPEDGELLAAHLIPTWVDGWLERHGKKGADPLEGHLDQAAKDESTAWVALLEGQIHAALVLAQPTSSYISSLLNLSAGNSRPFNSLLNPPPAPFTGLTSLVPPSGTRIAPSLVYAQYSDAIGALSERLGTDKWFLGSESPTALDALVFAYLHIILHSKEDVRIEVTRRVNLVAWEWRVRGLVRSAFTKIA
ncbi:hypothetical protein HGRIS_012938 [Hohenbuehelia grisea]|uniref:Metaxin glutathione S-transferase domain-containing protein n=1 Tax=Hohenbuehelia grisea TaxID=104357 RepID=A0ABR3IU14_9AGAR